MLKRCLRIVVFALAVIAFSTHSPAQAAPKGIYQEGKILDIAGAGDQGVISIGSKNGAATGERYMVIRAGGKIIDPATKKLIRIKQDVVGEVEVISSTATYSDVKIIKNTLAIKKGDGVRKKTSPPEGLNGKEIGFRKIELTWRMQPEPETVGYRIYRAASAKSGYELIGETAKRDEVVYLDKESRKNKLKDNTKYYYRVTAVNNLKNESDPSQPIKSKTMIAPPPPGGLKGKDGQIRAVALSWTIHTNVEVEGYRLYRSSSKKGKFEQIKDIKGRKEVSYSDYGEGSSSSPKLDDGKIYFYTIAAYSPYKDEGPRSKAVKATTAGSPIIPENFEAQGWHPRKAPLSWKAITDENIRGYLIYRSNDEKGPYEQIVEIKDRKKESYVDMGGSGFFKSGLKDFTLYFYKIQTYNWAGSRSKMSPAVSATTKAAPMPPEDLKATSKRPKQVPLAWRLSPEADIAEYRVYRTDRRDGEFKKVVVLPADKSYYLDGKLENNATYYYKMKVSDKFGLVSEYSSIVSAATKQLPKKVMGIDWKKKDGSIALKWEKNRERDIKIYRVHKKGFFGWTTVGETEETIFVIPGFKTGDKGDFAISAIDIDELEGEKSGTLTIDLR